MSRVVELWREAELLWAYKALDSAHKSAVLQMVKDLAEKR
jgi:hypothetical protein